MKYTLILSLSFLTSSLLVASEQNRRPIPTALLKQMVEAGTRTPSSVLRTAVLRDDLDFVQFLLERGANPNTDYAVFSACLFSPYGQRESAATSTAMIKTLVEAGADVTGRINRNGSTMFMQLASPCCNYTPEQMEELFNTLVKAGAPTNSQCLTTNRTAAQIAARRAHECESCQRLQDLLEQHNSNSK